MEPIERTEGNQSSSIASKPRTVESNESIDGRVVALERSEQVVQQLCARVSLSETGWWGAWIQFPVYLWSLKCMRCLNESRYGPNILMITPLSLCLPHVHLHVWKI